MELSLHYHCCILHDPEVFLGLEIIIFVCTSKCMHNLADIYYVKFCHQVFYFATSKKMWWQMRVVKPAREAAAPERQPSDLALEKRLAHGRSQSPRLCVCVILLFDDDLVD